jgi:hypothetical protein
MSAEDVGVAARTSTVAPLTSPPCFSSQASPRPCPATLALSDWAGRLDPELETNTQHARTPRTERLLYRPQRDRVPGMSDQRLLPPIPRPIDGAHVCHGSARALADPRHEDVRSTALHPGTGGDDVGEQGGVRCSDHSFPTS